MGNLAGLGSCCDLEFGPAKGFGANVSSANRCIP